MKSVHLRDASVELELYVEPVQNYQWKYRQERKPSPQRIGLLESLRVQVPFEINPTAVRVDRQTVQPVPATQ